MVPSDSQNSKHEALVRDAEAGTLSVAQGTRRSQWKELGRLFTDWHFASRVVRKRLGMAVAMETEDRRVLEKVIFPFYAAQTSIRSVLFVGCDWYTRHYQKEFFSGLDYWTLDVDPDRRKYGARQHIVGPLESLSSHFPPERFNLILCNGVYGWGLNAREQIDSAFAQCHRTIASGGHFMLGWDDIEERRPVPLDQIESLNAFAHFEFPPLGTGRYTTQTPYRHTYDFYRK